MPRAQHRRVALVIAVLGLACNQGLEPVTASGQCPPNFTGICGTVRFRGTVPDSTDLVWIVAFAQFPQSAADLITFKPNPPPEVPFADTAATYRMALAPGRYEWVLAVWKKEGTLTLVNADTLLREAGFYRDPGNPALPGAVDVSGGHGGIDFIVDYGDMHPISYWFPTPAARP